MTDRELFAQAAAALKVSAWDHIHAVGKQALIDAIIDRLAQPDAEPVAWAMLRADGLILDVICPDERESYQGEYTVQLYAAPPAAPAPGDMVMVPLKFVQDFNTLAHNYCLRAVPPDYYSGTEADAFQHAYSRCGSDLRRLREILAAAPAPADWGTPHDVSGAPWGAPAPAVCDGGTCGLGGYCTNCPRLSAAPAVREPQDERIRWRDAVIKEAESALRTAEQEFADMPTWANVGHAAKKVTHALAVIAVLGIGGGGK